MSYKIIDAIKDEITGNAEYVSKEEKKRRLSICEQCSLFKHLTRRCSICGCFMDVKTLYTKSACPANKPKW